MHVLIDTTLAARVPFSGTGSGGQPEGVLRPNHVQTP